MTTSKLKPIVLRPHEARRLAECGEVLVIRAMKPQPEMRMCDGYDKPMPFIPFDESGKLRCPLGPVGERRFVRETYATTKNLNHGWGTPIYKATFGAAMMPICEGFTPWMPPATMPRNLSRFVVVVESVAGRQIQSVTDEEALSAGHQPIQRMLGHGETMPRMSMRLSFDKKNGPDAWERNDFFWFAVTRRVEG